ncbi:hypothetical protein LIER_26981 [Lithospermum erythrorhizon]|uniref:Uncharacterized protein n=1 Tax=Lithospermum erythrorhizon TaxID=34254 RepID=A0AAV3RBK7_LITER
MNRNYRGQQMGGLRASTMKEKDEELALFLEMRRREKERQNLLLINGSDEFDDSLGPRMGTSPIFNLDTATQARKTASDDFLNSENDKNDYDWLLTPPGTPLFPSLEMESQRTVMSQQGEPKARPVALKSRLANLPQEPATRSNISSRQPTSSPGLNTSTAGLRRPSSSGGSGSRPSTPTGRPSLTTGSRTTSTSTTKSAPTNSSRTTSTATSRAPLTSSRPSRSATPTRTTTSNKSTVPARSATPTSRSTSRSSTPTSRPSVPAPKSTSRAATPTRRSATASSVTNGPSPSIKPRPPSSGTISSSSVTRPVSSQTKNPVAPRSSSPSIKPRPWKPSEMPGFSLDAPPNLRTTLPDRPLSATRGRPGAAARSSSVEPISNGKVRRQSCSPSRGRPPNGMIHSGSSVPAMNRLHAKANDNVSPVLVGTKMVERVINMRKLAPPKQDEKHSPHSNLSVKSSSPDSSGFGRNLSKKSLDMAIRHMDIRRSIPGNLRPLMTNIPASSMYSVRSGPARSRTVSVSDSPLATSSNASSDMSISNNGYFVEGVELDDDVSSSKGPRSPASVRGR